MVLSNTRNGGVYQGVAASIGHGLGICIYAFLAVSGLGIILINNPEIYNLITYIGVLILFLFGFQLILEGVKNKNSDIDKLLRSKTLGGGFFQGLIVAIINPKVIIFFIALFSQYMIKDSTLFDKVSIIFVAGIIDFLWYLIIAVIFSRTIIVTLLLKYKFVCDISIGFIFLLFSLFIVLKNINIL